MRLRLTARLGLQLADRCDLLNDDGRVRPARLVSVGEATYLRLECSACPIRLWLGSFMRPQEPAKISCVRRPNRNASARA